MLSFTRAMTLRCIWITLDDQRHCLFKNFLQICTGSSGINAEYGKQGMSQGVELATWATSVKWTDYTLDDDELVSLMNKLKSRIETVYGGDGEKRVKLVVVVISLQPYFYPTCFFFLFFF
eukprot:TRINITY_DN19_c0_g1_i13.p1 TRINITY_DN19_c0_g1~~TRINITY_DN19_c0_g1_i13.p1  ORF type:complete len:120 (+),score=27.27 TRINITY_DN19_c0_g1_i13:162-521(+)